MSQFLVYFDQFYQGRNQFIQSFSIIIEANSADEAKTLALAQINSNTTNAAAQMTQNKGAAYNTPIPIHQTLGAVNIVKSVQRIKGT